ncbi:RNA polymerase factor sigma-54 [Terrisporobacter mayombei]|uniref:RNA polymerase sigma-54 factor n=1 Tax=Terrisporobacter mayombei TaxID=1541 RepID=A0ABY9Q5K8_9FIRM|nr:RNA polymerase factor sigma-54 [Terrisporobacter mayombei]MCC3869802.1 RNA polymerase factor sigma-54 [Terrisporobacter mayombei]WMT83257.1 RNA polymerase sigma-54 factor [Terrisporobacter mayombei]
MNLNNRLDIIQSQKLVMTTQLKQSLDILNMSNLELEDEIKRESEENPVLEIENKGDVDWEEFAKNIDNKSYNIKSYDLDNDFTLENLARYESNLYDYVKEQLSFLKLSNKEKEVCEYIVDCLDKDGYLGADEEFILEELHIDNNYFEACLKNIQQLEPSGIGARSLSECLLIQMKNKNINDDILKSIIIEDLNLIGKNKIKFISKKYDICIEECVEYIEQIKEFDPKPGRLCSSEKTVYIQPDVTVRKIDGEFIVYMNDNANFHLCINNYYKSVLSSPASDENAKEFIKNKLNHALNLLKNIETRKSTILKIAEVIVREQKEFFIKGAKNIKPMRLKDIALDLGYHESTISRGINGKYMLTPFGLFEFKYFFSTAIQSEEEEGTSSTKIKNMIKEFINKENKLKPLSDDKICKLLKGEGITVARRTVAKYREEMNILSSSKRKQFVK